MPRRPQAFVEGGLYDVYNRFARGAGVFGERADAERSVELLRRVLGRDELTAFAWALTSNSSHAAPTRRLRRRRM